MSRAWARASSDTIAETPRDDRRLSGETPERNATHRGVVCGSTLRDWFSVPCSRTTRLINTVYAQTLNVLLDMLRLRTGPQDLPTSIGLLVVMVALSSVISLIGLSQLGGDQGIGPQIAVAGGFTLLFTWVALQFRGGVERFIQTTTALFGTDAILTIIALPATTGLDPESGEASPLAAAWLLMVLLWTVAVIGHIFRHALNLPLAGGVLVSLLYLFLSLNVTAAIT